MKKGFCFIAAVYIFLFVCGSVFAADERTITLGGASTWRAAETRAGLTEVPGVRPYPVLILSSANGNNASGYSAAVGVLGEFMPLSESALDLYISFDERNVSHFNDSTGHYTVKTSGGLESVDHRFARSGSAAALFGGPDITNHSAPLVIEPRSRNSLFAPGNRMSDFTVEFWINPINAENGEQIFSWISSRPVHGNPVVQRIQCISIRNRIRWSFLNFFTSADGESFVNLDIEMDSYLVPKVWSHHLIRFDATTGMLEYIVDGRSENILYATRSGREGGEVFTPIAGNGGVFEVGRNFNGIMDELKIHSVFAGRNSLDKYTRAGGRMQTKAVDLGTFNSVLQKIDVSGGRTSIQGNRRSNEFRQNGRFRFGDDSEMNFFVRAGDNPYLLNEVPWIRFTAGAAITEIIRGRYVQFAVDFYPSADGLTTPYLDELRIVFTPNDPPLPPSNFTAVAVDGGVYLNWRRSPDRNTKGYLVYYSEVRDELFGKGALLGDSPINAGDDTSIMIDGLKNGTLYYFRIASYDTAGNSSAQIVGEFSREITARPLAGLSLEALSMGF